MISAIERVDIKLPSHLVDRLESLSLDSNMSTAAILELLLSSYLTTDQRR